MTKISGILGMGLFSAVLLLAVPGISHGPSGHPEKEQHMDKEKMKAQHERMGNFREAAESIFNAIVYSSGRMAQEGAEKLEKSLAGHETDMPHKNRSRAKEFHGLFVELGKRTTKLKKAIADNDLPKAAVAYGRILETCTTCHGIFRD
ncbi:MAG: hypothetical protein Kow00128_06940 [Deltaproteobacteria bacterium]